MQYDSRLVTGCTKQLMETIARSEKAHSSFPPLFGQQRDDLFLHF